MELAIFEDCRNLIESFLSANDYSFKGFCEQWKIKCFQYIYSAQTTTIEVIQTTRAILQVAKQIACNRSNAGHIIESIFENTNRQLYRRIGGLFLLYAVYFKQPTKQYVKIQVSLNTWGELSEFIKTLPQEPSLDEARYIFWRLYQGNAFSFTGLDYHMGLENLVDYDNINDDKSAGSGLSGSCLQLKNKEELLTVQSQFNTKLTLEQEYNKLKEKISGGRNEIAKTLPPTKIFQDINESLKNTIQIFSTHNSNNNTANGNNEQAYSTKRQTKRKAACFFDDDTIAASINNSHQSDEEHENANDDSDESTIGRALRRMSARSLFLEKLPKSVLDELNDASKSSDEEEVNETQ